MPRKLRPAWSDSAFRVSDAIWHLREARELLKITDSPQALKRVRLAISSALGAKRHAERRVDHMKKER